MVPRVKGLSGTRWISFSEISRVLGCARLTARKRVADGTIPGKILFLRQLRVERQAFEKWLETQPI